MLDVAQSYSDEAAVINAIITRPRARRVIFERMSQEHFTHFVGRKMFEGFLSCWNRNIPVTSEAALKSVFQYGSETSKTFLSWGSECSHTWQESVDVLDKLEFARRIIRAAHIGTEAAKQLDLDKEGLIGAIRETWQPVIESTATAKVRTLHEMQREEAESFQAANEGRLKAPTWGIADLDRKCPVYPGEMAIIAARPSMGKSALCLTSIMAQINSGVGVGLISVEMDSKSILRRIYSAISGIQASDIQSGMRNADAIQLNELMKAREEVSKMGSLFHLQAGEKVGLDKIRTIAYDWVKNKGVKAIWIDYLTDLRLPKAEAYHLQVEAMSQGLRDLCRSDSLDVSLYLAAQLNRAGAQQYPAISHLRGSGAIEQDAHVVLLIDRPEREPHIKRPYLDRDGATKNMQGKAALVIGKNRNGATGTVFADFHGPTMTFKTEETIDTHRREIETDITEEWFNK